MNESASGQVLSLWDQLPKNEQERIKKQLNKVREDTPVAKAPKKNGQFQLKGYVRCELSAADKDSFREWEGSVSLPSIMETLIKAIDSGYLLKVGANDPGAQASLCAASTGQSWDGMVLVAHAGSAVRAACLLVYKHELMMGGDWSAWLSDEGEETLR